MRGMAGKPTRNLLSARTIQAGRSIFAPGARTVPPAQQGIQMIFQDPYGSLNPRMKVGLSEDSIKTSMRTSSAAGTASACVSRVRSS